MRARCLAILCALLLLAAGCGSKDDSSSSDGTPRGTLVVFAAASLTDAFTEIADDFEHAYPDVSVKTSYAGSQSLRTQIANGAQPQVFASANDLHMNALVDEGLVNEPITFVHNELVVVTPADNPAGIETFADLPKADRLVIADENVPAGRYAERALANAASEYGADFPERVKAAVVSRESHVRQTLQKVVLGEADAAIVYATDAASAGDKVKTIEIPSKHNVVASYPIATVKGAPRSHIGTLFVEHVLSDAGKARLKAAGFSPAGPAVAEK